MNLCLLSSVLCAVYIHVRSCEEREGKDESKKHRIAYFGHWLLPLSLLGRLYYVDGKSEAQRISVNSPKAITKVEIMSGQNWKASFLYSRSLCGFLLLLWLVWLPMVCVLQQFPTIKGRCMEGLFVPASKYFNSTNIYRAQTANVNSKCFLHPTQCSPNSCSSLLKTYLWKLNLWIDGLFLVKMQSDIFHISIRFLFPPYQ